MNPDPSARFHHRNLPLSPPCGRFPGGAGIAGAASVWSIIQEEFAGILHGDTLRTKPIIALTSFARLCRLQHLLVVVSRGSRIISDPARRFVQTVQIILDLAEVAPKLRPYLSTGKPGIEKVCSLWPDRLDTQFLGRPRNRESSHDGRR